METPEEPKPSFAQIGKSRQDANILSEFVSFLKHNKKWWLLPIIIIMLLFAALMVFSGGAAAPFIYTLF